MLTGNLDACLNLLLSANRLPEAAMFCRSYLPSKTAEVTAQWKGKSGIFVEISKSVIRHADWQKGWVYCQSREVPELVRSVRGVVDGRGLLQIDSRAPARLRLRRGGANHRARFDRGIDWLRGRRRERGRSPGRRSSRLRSKKTRSLAGQVQYLPFCTFFNTHMYKFIDYICTCTHSHGDNKHSNLERCNITSW